MAINFLNTVDLNKNQLNQAVIQNVATDPSSAVVGQIIFNTGEDTLKQYVADTGTGNPGWESIGGDIQKVDGGTYVTVTDPNGPIPVVNHDSTTRTDSTSSASPDYGASFTTVSSVTSNATGHVTAVDIKTVTLPENTNETYTLPVTAGTQAPGAPTTGVIKLTAGGTGSGVKSIVNFTGTSGRVDILGDPTGSAIIVDLTDSVTIVDSLALGEVLTVSGNGQSSFVGQVTIPETPVAATDAASKKFVLDQVAGLGSFQGGYDASSDPGSPALTGTSNIAFGQGDFYAVTTAGTITFSDSPTGDATLEVGDFIFSNTDIAINSNPASTDFTLIISDQNIAGAGATDGATPKGVAGFDSANFDVSASGWVQLNSQRNPYGASQALNNTAPCSRAESGGQTTFTINLADASLFGTGALAKNVKVEVTDGASPFQTVYAEVTRSGSASMAIAFTGAVAINAYRVLLTHV